MSIEIAKPFTRNGHHLRPGDAVPDDVDKPTLEHYRRHGMVREAKPAKPEKPAKAVKPTGPTEPAKQPAPQETKAPVPAPDEQE